MPQPITPQMLAIMDQRHEEMLEVLRGMTNQAIKARERLHTSTDVVIAGMNAIEKTGYPDYVLIGLLATAVVELSLR